MKNFKCMLIVLMSALCLVGSAHSADVGEEGTMVTLIGSDGGSVEVSAQSSGVLRKMIDNVGGELAPVPVEKASSKVLEMLFNPANKGLRRKHSFFLERQDLATVKELFNTANRLEMDEEVLRALGARVYDEILKPEQAGKLAKILQGIPNELFDYYVLQPKEGLGGLLLKVVKGGNSLDVRALLKLGAEVSVADRDGNTPLHIAAAAGNVDLAHILIKAGASKRAVNYSYSTPLTEAVRANQPAIVQMLLRAGARVEIPNVPDHLQPHAVARRVGNQQITDMLREALGKQFKEDVKAGISTWFDFLSF